MEQQTRNVKEHVFKMKRRKGYRKFQGFRTVRAPPPRFARAAPSLSSQAQGSDLKHVELESKRPRRRQAGQHEREDV